GPDLEPAPQAGAGPRARRRGPRRGEEGGILDPRAPAGPGGIEIPAPCRHGAGSAGGSALPGPRDPPTWIPALRVAGLDEDRPGHPGRPRLRSGPAEPLGRPPAGR